LNFHKRSLDVREKKQNLYYDICQYEQFASDYLTYKNLKNSVRFLEKLRLLSILAANAYINPILDDSILKTIETEFKKLKSRIKINKEESLNFSAEGKTFSFKAKEKIPECFNDFGIYPESLSYATKKIAKKLKNPVLVIGIRTAGSWLAPAVISQLKKMSVYYITLRPGFRIDRERHGVVINNKKIIDYKNYFPVIISYGEYKYFREILSKVIKQNGCILVVDEGPGTGATLNSILKFLLSMGIPKKIIYLISVRKFDNHNLINFGIFSGSRYFDLINYKLYKKEISQFLDKQNMKLLNFKYLRLKNSDLLGKQNLSLKNYENPKGKINIKFKSNEKIYSKTLFCKYLGFGDIGWKKYQVLVKLKDYVIEPLDFFEGIGVFPYIENKDKFIASDINKGQLIRMANYFVSRSKIFGSKKEGKAIFLNNLKNIIRNSANIEDWTLQQNFLKSYTDKLINKIGLMIKKCGSQNYIKTNLDWKLEDVEWLYYKNRLCKTDIFHCNDYANFPESDILVQIAGICIEFDINKNYANDLINIINKKLKTKYSYEYLLICKIFYLIWKINYYDYVLKNLKRYVYDMKTVEQKKNSLINKIRGVLVCLLERN